MVGRSPVLLLLLVVVVLVVGVHTWPGDTVFPEDETVDCETRSGGRGQCVDIHSCPGVLNTVHHTPPDHCGFDGDIPIVCCPISEDDVDASTPIVNFECGENPQNSVILQEWIPEKAQILRPEIPNRTADAASQHQPTIRPGIPQEAVDKLYEEIAVLQEQGIFAAVGGVPANKSAWPWMALLGRQDLSGIDWFCGGVLINDQWVLSALHCFLRKVPDIVRLGEHDYYDNFDGADHEDYSIAETVLHPDYSHPEAYHDLALLRLDTKVTLKKYISPVCLPWGKDANTDVTGQEVTLTGWGNTLYDGFPSSILQEVNVTVFPSSRCDASYSSLREYRKSWPRGISDETICAGDPNGGRDACQGDSGGPIVYLNSAWRYTLAGIVSRGYGCGHKDYPGLYVNIHQPNYLAWIKRVAFQRP
ncbi:venom protease-like [Panulirus ornatus]|uniref:venom protease-like n=1 Tax=Panulirus ornatus TaxID=150431 RepID=UPI003A84548D